ncbi:MFS transporter [candidate division KSB1 bacterium]|nr:MFS transporter [candidate division KSB1 bacterium]
MNDESRLNPSRKSTVSWILYDFANTIYSMNVVTMYFSTWLIVDLQFSDSFVSYANSISMIFVALTMPILGEISDRYRRKMPFLIFYTIACILATAGIGISGQLIGDQSVMILFAVLFFVIANYSYQGGLVFYNALLPQVTSERSMGRVSGYGVAVGYMGSILGLVFVLPFVEGNIYGLEIPFIPARGSVASFVPTAVLFLIFAIPIFIFVKDPPAKYKITQMRLNIVQSFKKVVEGLTNTRKYPGVTRFLIAKYFYEDAIQTVIIFMAVYAQKVMEFSKPETTTFFIAVIPSAIVGSALFGIITDNIGPKKALTIVLWGWIINLMLLILTMNTVVFWILGCITGIFLGSTWTSARPLLISLVPKEMLGEFFGLYSFSGKVAAIAGPLVWALVVELFESRGTVFKYKAAVGSLVIFIAIGLIILHKVPDIWKKK